MTSAHLDPDDSLWLGGAGDPRVDTLIDPNDLTTHGVIVGMTGSGKTGLGLVVLEEALLEGIPCLVLDPKGDLGNLLLTFPDLAAGDFAPWVGTDDDPAQVAQTWRDGLAGWGVEGDRIAALRERAELAVYTPGSTAGRPLDIIGSLEAPGPDVDTELAHDEIEALVTSLLGLVDIEADPLASPEHILLTNLIAHEWEAGRDLDLARLIGLVQKPPLRKLGVIELDSFVPADRRTALALRLNGLLASPSFAAWTTGEALDIERLLWPDGQRPAASVVALSHLSDSERQFAVSLILSKLITWMRRQPGSDELRVLVYIDEVMGFAPPSAAPPAKKPILTILKQARAFGVGMILSTQNPVDLDYKAISNAGTWMIGRLQTERDRDRLLDGMTSAAGAVDIGELASTIARLDKRQFVLHQTGGSTPSTFSTRWAMSYLAGPLTREQISRLSPPPEPDPARREPAAPATPELADDETELAPEVHEDLKVRWLDPAAPWAAELGAVPGGRRLRAGVCATVELLFDEHHADLRHSETWEAVLFPIDDGISVEDVSAVDHDERNLVAEAPDGAVYVLGSVELDRRGLVSELERDLTEYLYRHRTMTIYRNPTLKLWSRVGEDAEDFARRCQEVADEGYDGDAAELRDKVAKRYERVQAALARHQDRRRELEAAAAADRTERIGETVGDLLGSLLGGRSRSRTRRLARNLSGGGRSAAARRERIATAERRIAESIDDLAELEAELADDLVDLEEEWQERAADIEEREVGLEKSDIHVSEMTLIWVPT